MLKQTVSITCLIYSMSSLQVLAADEKNDAEALLSDTIQSISNLPKEYAVIVRSRELVLHRTDRVIESDTIYLYAERGVSAKIVGYGISNSDDGVFARRSWDLTVVSDGKKGRRAGNIVGRFKNEYIENADVDPDESKTKRFLPEFYPYFYPVAQTFDIGQRRVNKLFGRRMLDQYELISEKGAVGGMIESTWKLNKLELQITFDLSQGGRPVKIVRLGLPKTQGGERPKQSVQTIEWVKKPWGEDVMWVPTKFRRSSVGNGNQQGDLACVLRWKDTSKESVIPKLDEEDWREPIRQEFGEDWNWNFEDYMRNSDSER